MEVSDSASIPPTSLGRQNGERATSGALFLPSFTKEHPWGGHGLPTSSPSISLPGGLVVRCLFRVSPCRKGTIYLQTSMPSPGFKPRPTAHQLASLTTIPDGLIKEKSTSPVFEKITLL
ncbi:hypothetical protein TNCV_70771 [Trichonephila clavipes]|nr:hypothetical protein TNCV_70771 [Trichonephila clavipes]